MNEPPNITQACKNRLLAEIEKVIIGKTDQITLLLMAVFSGGHVLLNDLPGSGKTTLVKTLSKTLSCSFCRVQFTPDLLPSDILGMTVFNQKTGDFLLRKGPVFTNILLADEINRAIPRTQSALLEAMEEYQVTIDQETLPLPSPFFVMATQNPVDQESTFPLPAAQLDRFFIQLSLGYPKPSEEEEMLSRLGNPGPSISAGPVLEPGGFNEILREIQEVYVSPSICQYIVSLVHATRNHPQTETGASPRASKALFLGGRAWAAMDGRNFVTPDDIKAIALPILGHRITLNPQAHFSGLSKEQVIEEILSSTKVP